MGYLHEVYIVSWFISIMTCLSLTALMRSLRSGSPDGNREVLPAESGAKGGSGAFEDVSCAERCGSLDNCRDSKRHLLHPRRVENRVVLFRLRHRDVSSARPVKQAAARSVRTSRFIVVDCEETSVEVKIMSKMMARCTR